MASPPTETGTASDPGASTPGTPDPRGRSVGVWPVLAGVLVLGAVAVAGVPAVRAQAEQSFTRQSPEFVELSAVVLDEQSNVGTTCAPGKGGPGTTDVTFEVVSHLGERAELGARVVVTTEQGRLGAPQSDRIRLEPGETKSRTATVPVPAVGAWAVEVRLTDSDQYLLLRCPGVA